MCQRQKVDKANLEAFIADLLVENEQNIESMPQQQVNLRRNAAIFDLPILDRPVPIMTRYVNNDDEGRGVHLQRQQQNSGEPITSTPAPLLTRKREMDADSGYASSSLTRSRPPSTHVCYLSGHFIQI